MVKEPIEEEEEEEEEEKVGKRTGKWSDAEHQRFLDGMQMYGKDWLSVSKLIRTRDHKNVISHAQKFLVKLVKFLADQIDIDDLSKEDAEYFYGIMKHKINYQTSRVLKIKGPKPIFEIQKVEKKKEDPPYCIKEEANETIKERSFHQSLGFSVKYMYQEKEKPLFSFYSDFRWFEESDFDKDSANSHSEQHHFKFYVDDFLCDNKELTTRIYTEFFDALFALPDIESPNCKILWKAGKSGPEFDILTQESGRSALESYYHDWDVFESLRQNHPNLVSALQKNY